MNRLNLERANCLDKYLAHVESQLLKMEMIHNPQSISINEDLQCSINFDIRPIDGYSEERLKFCSDMHCAIIGFLKDEKEKILKEFEIL